MTHLHIDCDTQSYFRVYCMSKEFSLYITIQQICDENVSDDHLLPIFQITVFC